MFSYDANYPVSENPINWSTVLTKTLMLFSLLLSILVVSQEEWQPLFESFRDVDGLQVFCTFYKPTMLCYFFGFLILLDLAPNIWAELSGFEDR